MNFVICKRNRLQTYLLTNLIINLMVLVDKENVKGYVQMDEKELLAKDETYISIERELQLMIQEELINSVKDKVAASPRGKELLEKQLNNIKVKKEEIIKEANKNIEVFKRFQEAARLNPNLTYAEFVKSLN